VSCKFLNSHAMFLVDDTWNCELTFVFGRICVDGGIIVS
jgi:hypothetical protein